LVQTQAACIYPNSWYGVNGANYPSNPQANQTKWHFLTTSLPAVSGFPQGQVLPKISQMHHSSDLAFIFDGVGDNMWIGYYTSPLSDGTWRIQARHGSNVRYAAATGAAPGYYPSLTNILFVDGHADSIVRTSIPEYWADQPQTGPGINLFDLTSPNPLTNKYPYPKWRLDQ
jgi:prepilin-type processing-associated H-X9-DG protein